jgi:hypothetical protein
VRAHSQFRYEEVANLIAGLVNSGTLSPGSRAPSLREISRQQRISLSTALQAYRLLEDRGVLEPRPQSGHYVTKRPDTHLAAPAISDPPGKATPVAISATLLRLHQYSVTLSLFLWVGPSRMLNFWQPPGSIGFWLVRRAPRARLITPTLAQKVSCGCVRRSPGVRYAGARPFRRRTLSSRPAAWRQ